MQEWIWYAKCIWPHYPICICGHIFHQVYSYRNSKFCGQSAPPLRESQVPSIQSPQLL